MQKNPVSKKQNKTDGKSKNLNSKAGIACQRQTVNVHYFIKEQTTVSIIDYLKEAPKANKQTKSPLLLS